MKNLTPNSVALFNATLATLVSLIGFLFFSYLFNIQIIWGIIVIQSFTIFLSSFFFTRYAIKEFVAKKLKLIYKIIHNFKLNKETFPSKIKMDENLFNDVYQDVEAWGKQHKDEIETLKSQAQYRKEFLGNVSHELKTPIFNIQGYLLTLLEGGLEDETINRKFLMKAEKSVERMISIVEDLDIVSRLESGQLEMNLSKFEIHGLIKETFELLEMKAANKQINLKFRKTPDKNTFVIADKDRIRQVITNLIVNSIKYGKTGGTTEIRIYDMEENMLIEVADDGIGISSEHLPRLFERFYRVDKSRTRDSGGSGLGLAIVKHIIEAHEQTINVRSTEGIGSTFSFTLKKA